MRKNKDNAWSNFDASPNLENFNFAMIQDEIYNKEEHKLKCSYEKKLTNKLKNNSKGFYSYLRNKRKLKSGVPSLERPDGSRTTNAQESAEVLSKALVSVFTLNQKIYQRLCCQTMQN